MTEYIVVFGRDLYKILGPDNFDVSGTWDQWNDNKDIQLFFDFLINNHGFEKTKEKRVELIVEKDSLYILREGTKTLYRLIGPTKFNLDELWFDASIEVMKDELINKHNFRLVPSRIKVWDLEKWQRQRNGYID